MKSFFNVTMLPHSIAWTSNAKDHLWIVRMHRNVATELRPERKSQYLGCLSDDIVRVVTHFSMQRTSQPLISSFSLRLSTQLTKHEECVGGKDDSSFVYESSPVCFECLNVQSYVLFSCVVCQWLSRYGIYGILEIPLLSANFNIVNVCLYKVHKPCHGQTNSLEASWSNLVLYSFLIFLG